MSKRKRSGPKQPDHENYKARVELAAHARAAKLAAVPLDAGAIRPGRRLIDKKQLLAKVPASFVTINGWILKGWFPKPFMMGGKAVWWEDEVDEALHKLLLQRA